MAQIEDAMEELDDAAAKLEAQIKRATALLKVNREQKRRLELGMSAIKTSATKDLFTRVE